MRRVAAWVAAALICGGAAGLHAAQWPQWGGPSRDFSIARGTAPWDAAGPQRLWTRPLGDGFSGIVVAEGLAFTSYRDGDADVTVALDARTGETRWEHRADAPFRETCSEQLGAAPRSTPLAAGSWLFTVSAGGKLQALERANGRLAWQQELYGEQPALVRACGYSASPIAVGDAVIVPAGGPGRAVMSFAMRDGAIRWQRHDFAVGYSSPIAIAVGGQTQLVMLMGEAVIGIEPESGALLWQHPHPTYADVNVMTPIWSGDGVLFISSGYDGGSRALRLTRAGDATRVEELWAHKRFRVHFGNAVRIGRMMIGSNGDFSSAPVAGIDIDTGEVLWRSRASARASFLALGAQVLMLSEDGRLVLATPTREGLRVDAEAAILDGVAWTAPAVADGVLLVRDRRVIAAYALPSGSPNRVRDTP